MSLHRYVAAGVLFALTACSSADTATAPSDLPALSKGGAKSASSTPRVELKIRLVAPATSAIAGATGSAEFRSRRTELEFKAEVEHVNAGDQFNVFVDGVQVGATITASALGEAELSLRSKNGATVPAIVAGSLVEIKTTAGDLVVSGTF